MLHIHRIILLLLFIISYSLANIPYVPSKITALNEPTTPEILTEITKEQLFKVKKLSDEEIEEIEQIFKSSPQEAQCIVNHLQDPTFFALNQDYRSAIFFGESNSNKTKMAKIIAHKMSLEGWKYKHLSNESLKSYGCCTHIALEQELEKISLSKLPTILIIDDIDQLLKHTPGRPDYTNPKSIALWKLLDEQQYNSQFFFIGTATNIKILPKRYKARFLMDIIEFPQNI